MAKTEKSRISPANLHWRLYTLEDFLDTQHSLGMKSIEFWAGSPHFLLGWEGYQDCGPVKKAFEERGLRISALLIESVSYPFTLCCAVPEVWEKSVSYFKNGIKAARELGAPIAVISCAGGLYDKGKEFARSQALKALNEIAKTAEEEGVMLAVETLTPDQSFVINTAEELKDLISEVGSPNIKACLDVCSARTAGETLDQWFDIFGDDLVHIHFTDGRPEGRLVWGEGLHPLDEYLEVLENRGYKGALGLNINVRGNWFDPSLLDEKLGFTGKEHVPDNYWFAPGEADKANLRALAPYISE